MTDDTQEAIKHNEEMEKRYQGIDPIKRCVELAAQALDVSPSSTYAVMFSFVLGGYKAFCSSSEIHDDHGHYVEVIYNDRKDEFYVVHYEETERHTYER